jgi:hypothetical protein
MGIQKRKLVFGEKDEKNAKFLLTSAKRGGIL